MKLDLTSFAFGFAINGSNGNPNWATALGQGALYKINQSDSINEIIKGIVYNSISLSLVQAKIGKGGRVYGGVDPDSGIVLGGVFEKVYVNGGLVPDCKLVIILTRDMTQSHEGRLRLKYSPHNIALNADGSIAVSNVDQFDKIRKALGLSANACWFVYEMDVVDQDQLHLRVGIADPNANVSYASTSDLHNKWNDIIVAAGGTPASLPVDDVARQLITYGAPGTGKSKQTKDEVAGHVWFRTTFHPDSDYASFVGAYKPMMKDDGVALTEVAQKDAAGQLVGTEIHDQRKGIAYGFVDQVFMKAYVEAWRRQKNAAAGATPEPVFLVIEEINRGNCAQIFGDVFQLLDRNGMGFSEYPVEPDSDLGQFIAAKIADDEAVIDAARKDAINGLYPEAKFDVVEKVLKGEQLVLPNNLYIRATMNTSDQSLFPMDSAFKRRWDWKYVPIKNANLGWEIKFGDFDKDWWKFLVKINKVVKSVTNSADKQLGYFFVKLNEGETEISADMFVNKVAFYLWNDVFKDCELDGDAFKIMREDGDGVLAFEDFFKDDGSINEDVLRNFLETLVPEEPPKQE